MLLNCEILPTLILFSLFLSRLLVQQVFLGPTEAFARPGQVRQNNLRSLCLSSATLPSDYNRLVVTIDHQVLVRVLSHHEQMWLWLLDSSASSLSLSEISVCLRHRRVENV